MTTFAQTDQEIAAADRVAQIAAHKVRQHIKTTGDADSYEIYLDSASSGSGFVKTFDEWQAATVC